MEAISDGKIVHTVHVNFDEASSTALEEIFWSSLEEGFYGKKHTWNIESSTERSSNVEIADVAEVERPNVPDLKLIDIDKSIAKEFTSRYNCFGLQSLRTKR